VDAYPIDRKLHYHDISHRVDDNQSVVLSSMTELIGFVSLMFSQKLLALLNVLIYGWSPNMQDELKNDIPYI
jgi:hypothetical protein